MVGQETTGPGGIAFALRTVPVMQRIAALIAQRATETAVGRIGDPRDMAYLVAFLASGKAGYITGTTILVDGGLVRSVL